MAREMDLPIRRSRAEMSTEICTAFEEYLSYKKDKIDRYTKQEQLGDTGKEGTTFLVLDNDNNKEYAMKTFKKTKSSDKLRVEYRLQKKAGKAGVAPLAVDYDTVSKYILMERMDTHLCHYLEKKKGVLSKAHQDRIIEIFHTLDDLGIYHNDSNLMNYMMKNKKIFIIDFGFAREITDKLVKSLGTDRPNSHLMLTGFILKLKEGNVPEKSYKYLLKALPEYYRKRYGL